MSAKSYAASRRDAAAFCLGAAELSHFAHRPHMSKDDLRHERIDDADSYEARRGRPSYLKWPNT